MSVGLTARQRELLAYLRDREVCPTYREMLKALGWNSMSSLRERLQALHERGFIARHWDRNGNLISRSIEVIDKSFPINGRRYRFIPKTRAKNVPGIVGRG